MFLILSSTATSRPTGASSKTFLPPASPSTCSYMQEVCFFNVKPHFFLTFPRITASTREKREGDREREREQTSFLCLRLRISSSCQSLRTGLCKKKKKTTQQETLVLVPFHAGVDTHTLPLFLTLYCTTYEKTPPTKRVARWMKCVARRCSALMEQLSSSSIGSFGVCVCFLFSLWIRERKCLLSPGGT